MITSSKSAVIAVISRILQVEGSPCLPSVKQNRAFVWQQQLTVNQPRLPPPPAIGKNFDPQFRGIVGRLSFSLSEVPDTKSPVVERRLRLTSARLVFAISLTATSAPAIVCSRNGSNRRRYLEAGGFVFDSIIADPIPEGGSRHQARAA